MRRAVQRGCYQPLGRPASCRSLCRGRASYEAARTQRSPTPHVKFGRLAGCRASSISLEETLPRPVRAVTCATPSVWCALLTGPTVLRLAGAA